MSEQTSVELRVSVDVGYRRHSVALGLSSGEVLEEFEIDHRIEGFQQLFSRIESRGRGTLRRELADGAACFATTMS